MTDSMRYAIDRTNRRTVQEAYNRRHDIEPQSIVKGIRDLTDRGRSLAEPRPNTRWMTAAAVSCSTANPEHLAPGRRSKLIKSIEQEMKDAARGAGVRKAAGCDQLVELRRIEVERKVAA